MLIIPLTNNKIPHLVFARDLQILHELSRKLSKIIVALVLLIFVESCVYTKKKSLWITDEDKTELVGIMLEGVVKQGGWFDYRVEHEGKKILVLSSNNIRREFLPKFTDVEILLYTPNQLQQKADSEGCFMYLWFGKWEAHGPDTVSIPMGSSWMLGKKDRGIIPMSGGGLHFIWVRENSKWVNYGFSSWKH